MSTTITCLEKIDIRRGDKDADDARLYLVKYLHQFIDMVGILSLEVYDFAIEIEGDLISWCEGKIGGSKSQPEKSEWEEEIVKHRAVDAIDCILNDVDATVILSYKVTYNSYKVKFGKEYWNYILQGLFSKEMVFHGLQYDDTANVSMLHLEHGEFADEPAPVPKEKVDDIPIWHCCQLEISWDTEDVFTAGQFTRLEKAIASVRDLFVDKDNGIAVIEDDSLFICSQVIIPKESVPRLCSFLTVLYLFSRLLGNTIYDSMQFVPWYFQEFAVMSIDFDKGIALPTYYRY